MSGIEIRVERPLIGAERPEVEAFLGRFGLRFEGNPGTTLLAEDGSGNLVGTASLEGDLIKMAAVDPDLQEGGVLSSLVSRLVEIGREEGRTRLFVYTKPEAADRFRSLGFEELARTDQAIFLEAGAPGIAAFRRELREIARESDSGETAALVVNAHPFTLGHRYLVERASADFRRVYLIVVETDLSSFPFADRYEMIRRGVADLGRVRLVRSGPYAVSAATFPAYFLKSAEDLSVARVQGEMDAAVFASVFAPELRIRRRYVGTEPYCPVTAVYNEALAARLPGLGIELVRIPRLESEPGAPVSASLVRAAIREGNREQMARLLPPSTLEYLLDPARESLLARIRSGAGRH
jgi:[citrate (pro-3S)-lyase] ligase